MKINKRDIAIIGIGGKYPQADSLSGFLELLRIGQDLVRPLSAERISQTAIPFGKDYQIMGFLEGIDQFDAPFFGMAEGEAIHMDPRQRLLLAAAYHAFESAGQGLNAVQGSDTGVFLADAKLDYYQHAEAYDPALVTGNNNAAMAGRIARFFNLRGTAEVVDTACSSALTALHHACNSLLLGDVGQALVGGASLMLFPPEKSRNTGMGIESPTGKARAFSAEADGTSNGELVACLLLKPLDSALEANDPVYAIIKSAAVNQDAALSASFTAPDSIAQSEVILKAWQKAGIDPATINYIEAHGTGTKLGDPIEIDGIDQAFEAGGVPKGHTCAVSSVKSNLGHTDSTAGLAGLIKAVLSLHTKKLMPSLHVTALNPFIDFEKSVTSVNTSLKPWPLPDNATLRRCGVSSFGLTGTNTHVVLQEAPEAVTDEIATPQLVLLSAHHPESLKQQAEDLLEYIAQHPDTHLTPLAATLQRRGQFPYRWCTVADSVATLQKALAEVADTAVAPSEGMAKYFILFPGTGNVNQQLAGQLCDQDEVFAQYWQQAAMHFKREPGEGTVLLAYQYALYHSLKEKGVHSRYLIGDGVGKLVIAVLQGKQTLVEAMADTESAVPGTLAQIQLRMEKMLQAEATADTLGLIALSPNSNMAEGLSPMLPGFPKARLHAPEIGEGMLAQLLAGLFMEGVGIAPMTKAPLLKLLPPYPFQSKRLWLKPPTSRPETDWLYDVVWESTAIDPQGLASELVMITLEEVLPEWVDTLHQQGVNVTHVQLGQTAYTCDDWRRYRLRQAHMADWEKMLAHWQRQEITPVQVLVVAPDRIAPVEALQSMMHIVQGLEAWMTEGTPSLCLVTKQGHALSAGEQPNPTHAAMQGVFNSLSQEYLALETRCIDLAASVALETFVQVLATPTAQTQTAIRGSEAFVPTLVHREQIENNEVSIAVGGHYLITGGTGGIGMLIGEALAAQGIAHITLLGRKKLDTHKPWATLAADQGEFQEYYDTFAKWEQQGSQVSYYRAPLGDHEAVSKAIANAKEKAGVVTGVFHTAGAPGKKYLRNHSETSFMEALEPKIQGTIHLHQVLQAHRPDFYLLFSSQNAWLGHERGTNYGAANAWMDAYANAQSQVGEPFVAVNWPGWHQTGMLARTLVPGHQESYQESLLGNQEGLRLIFKLIGQTKPNTLVSKIAPAQMPPNPFWHMPDNRDLMGAADTENASIGRYEDNPAWTATQNTVAACWYEVLRSEDMALTDDFFELGGHSLSGMQVANKIQERLKVPIDFDEVFAYPTLGELAQRVEGLLSGNSEAVEVISPTPERPFYPMSHAQKRLWLLDQMEPGMIAYNIPGAFKVYGTLDVSRLAKAFEAVVDRHESLRTTFGMEAGEPVQYIHAPGHIGFAVLIHDLRNEPDKEAQSMAMANKEAATPFDLEKGPLLRVSLLQLDDTTYVLLFTMHHIVSDLWSLNILFEETINHYRGASLSPLSIQYKDYAAWQNGLLGANGDSAAQTYWEGQFASLPEPLALATDRPRPHIMTYDGTTLQRMIPKQALDNLNTLARRENTSLFILLTAMAKTLLHRYTLQEDIVVGTPVLGRDNPALEPLIGYFANTLALRTTVDSGQPFSEFLAQVKAVCMDAYQHQAYPFDKLVDGLGLQRDMSRSPLFDVVVVLQNQQNSTVPQGEGGFQMEAYHTERVISKFDITFNFTEQKEGLKLNLEYNTGLFDSQRMERMVGHLVCLIEGILHNPSQPLSALPMASEEEQQTLLALHDRTHMEWNQGDTIVSLFVQAVESHSDRVALTYQGEELTYQALDELSNQMAHAIQAVNGPLDNDTLVAIMYERSADMVAAILAVLKCGAAYLPLDPSLPASRVSYILNDARPVLVVVAGEATAAPFDLGDTTLLCLSQENLTPHPATHLTTAPMPEDVAYVIYTSGSTGQPKGVMVEHRQVTRLLYCEGFDFDFGPTDTWVLFHSISFDFSVWELWGALLNGGKLLVLSQDTARSPQALLDELLQHQVTVLNQVPTMFGQLWGAIAEASSLPSLALRYVIFGGEALQPTMLEGFYTQYPNTRLVNMYGITETTVHVTYKEIGKEEIAQGLSNIGRALPTLGLYLLGTNGQLAPRGTVGELAVAGAGVARGYLNRPKLTAQRFIASPHHEGQKLYLSGDLGVLNEEGELVYVGRKDRQVKVRGYRIELGEVTSALLGLPGVSNAAVTVRTDTTGDKVLVGYIVSGESLSTERLREGLSEVLPTYMVPSRFLQIDRLPYTTNGKLDTAALPMPESDRDGDCTGFVGARNATEEKLVSIWEEHLGQQGIGIHDNFFALGGDSIKAVRVSTAVNKVLDTRMQVRYLFENPDIARLAQVLETAGNEGPDIEAQLIEGLRRMDTLKQAILATENQTAILPEGIEDIYPLSAIESGMVYASMLREEEPVYYDQFLMQFEMESTERFHEALSMVVSRHENLRARFYMSRFEESVKAIAPVSDLPCKSEDLKGMTAAAQEQHIKAYMLQDQQRRLDFDGCLLWQMQLFHLGNQQYFCVWSVHHAILDGWSVSRFMEEMTHLLGAPGGFAKAQLPSMPHDYKSYTAVQMVRQEAAESLDFWKTYLTGYTRCKLPFNYSGKKKRDTGGMKAQWLFGDEQLSDDLAKLSQTHGISTKNVCFAAYLYLMRLICAEQDLVTGLVSHDRPELEGSELILGCFLHTVPFRMTVGSRQSPLALMKAVETQAAKIKPHELHLATLAAAVGEKTTVGNPIFDCLFNFTDFEPLTENTHQEQAATQQFEDELLQRGAEMTNTLFDLEVDNTGQLMARVKYTPAYFDDEEMAYALRLYLRVLSHFVRNAEQEATPSALLTQEEIAETLYTFNDTITPYDTGQTMHGLFEAQAVRTPEAIAIRQHGQTVSYSDLNQQANQIAHRLIELGVTPGQNVALICGRHAGMVASLLGILKAGAAYVPVDPEYPEDRQRYIIGNSKVAAVITDQNDRQDTTGLPCLQLGNVAIQEAPGSNPEVSISGDALAYTIYTSGSTGRPKGVMINHHSAVNLINWVNKTYQVGTADRLLFITSMCFDLSVYDIFGTLAVGAGIVIATPEEVRDFPTLKKMMVQERITFWDSVPTTMNYLITELENDPDTYTQSELRVVFMSGDWIPVNLPDRVKAFYPGAAVVSLGGATEGTVWSNYFPLLETDPAWPSIPYGRPIDNNFFYILDEERQPLPKGVVGELYIGGAGVAVGYANDSEKTDAAFVADPFSQTLGGRMYRTGDLGRMRHDMQMEFIGRKDHQVKIRGYRVELGEIENQLYKHPAIKEAVVAALHDEAGQNYLVAYVVSSESLNPNDISAYLAEALPDYMIPRQYVALSALPLNSNGKVDRKALPKPDQLPPRETSMIEATTEHEVKVSEIWKDILKVDVLDIHTNLFELGAHSLSVGSFVNRLERAEGLRLPIRDVFAYPTVEELAGLVASMDESDHVGGNEIAKVADAEDYPLSRAQYRLWLLDQHVEGLLAYNMPGAYIFEGPLDIAAFTEAMAGLVQRHEALRTNFVQVAGAPRQKVHATDQVTFTLTTASPKAGEQEAKAIARLVKQEAITPFDLANDSLIRATLMSLQGERTLFLLTLHHIVADGASMQVLLSDLQALYTTARTGSAATLPTLRIQYRDYAAWQEGVVGQSQAAMAQYWKKALQGAPPRVPLRGDRAPSEVGQSYQGGVHAFRLGPEFSQWVEGLRKDTGATPFAVLMAINYLWLYKETGSADLTIGTPVSGREHADLEHLIGFFVNMLPLRVNADTETGLLPLISQVKDTSIAAFANQRYPFDQLVEDLGIPAGQANPIFNVTSTIEVFDEVFEEQPETTQGGMGVFGNDLRVEALNVETQASKYSLAIEWKLAPGQAAVNLIYSTGVFEHDTILLMYERFKRLLTALYEQPDTRLDALPYQLEEAQEETADDELGFNL